MHEQLRKMQEVILTIKQNEKLAEGIFRMVLEGDVSAVTAPGQFVNIKLPGRYLRRPISVCDCEKGNGTGNLTLIYKILGEGTAEMSAMEPGTELSILTGLGNGFDVSKAGSTPVLIGGGIGIPPLYWLAKELIKIRLAAGMNAEDAAGEITVVLGFNSSSEIFYEKEFKELGCRVIVATADGSYGIKGYVTTPFLQGKQAADPSQKYSYYYTCGPLPMLKAVHKTMDIPGELSLEERMGCGFGACMGCSIKVRGGYKRVCKDGPVFSSGELIWED